MTCQLVTRDLFARYGSQTVLESVSLTFQPGRLTGIIGPNGSGKSTLLRILAGLKAPCSGTVQVVSRNPDRILPVPHPSLARILAFLPQSVRWEFSLTVRQLVALGRFPFGNLFGRLSAADDRIVEQAVQSVGLENLIDQSLDCLSGGEQQRAQLAACFAQEPRVLLLDEPTNHLDWGQIRRLMQLLVQFRSNGSNPGQNPDQELRTVVGIFHDLDAVRSYCNTIVCLKSGRVRAQGDPKELLTPEFVEELYLSRDS